MVGHLAKLTRTAAVLSALAGLALVGYAFARRFVYPYDLEWMEGGMLGHSLRLLEGRGIYAPPSVDFIPYLYTPLYPALLALLAKLVGLGYGLGRAVSIAAFATALWVGYRFIARHGQSRAAGIVAMALPAMAWVKTGTFYDIARPDSLWLALIAAGLLTLHDAVRDEQGGRRTEPRRHLRVALCALLLVAAFFAKQTASPLMLAAGAALLLLDWRAAPTLALVAAAVGGPTLLALDRSSDGWFWRYVFQLHQQHDFYAERAFRETPITLLGILGPALVLVPWALLRRRSVALLYAGWLALVGAVVASVAFGTQWAFTNAYIPGIYFPAVAIGVALGRLGGISALKGPRLRPIVAYAVAASSLWLLRFDPRPFIPTAADRRAGDRLVARLRETRGEVLIPFHPFYGHLAGKRAYLHRMGVLDVWRAGLGAPRGLEEALRSHRFALVVMDNKIAGNWNLWPGLLDAYEEIPPLVGPGCVTGAATHPAHLLVPRRSPPPPDPALDRELQ